MRQSPDSAPDGDAVRPPMLSIPPNVAAILIAGLEAEISRQEAIAPTCGDDWPDDYDPNDVAIYRGFRTWLLENSGRDAALTVKATSKPTKFVLGLIPYFVRERFDQLSGSDIDAAFRTYSEYVALFCADILRNEALLRSSAVDWALHALSKVIEFPRKPNSPAPGEPRT